MPTIIVGHDRAPLPRPTDPADEKRQIAVIAAATLADTDVAQTRLPPQVRFTKLSRRPAAWARCLSQASLQMSMGSGGSGMKDGYVAGILAGLPLVCVRPRADVQTAALGKRHRFWWAPLILIAGSTAPAAAAVIALQPGLYELTTITADRGLPSVTRTCFSAAYALGDFARPQVDASCRTVHDQVSEGRIRIATRCGTAANRSVQTVDGKYSATRFETVTHVSGRGGGSPRSITFRTTGHRLRRFCVPTF